MSRNYLPVPVCVFVSRQVFKARTRRRERTKKESTREPGYDIFHENELRLANLPE